jgi:hypothetical protein
MSSLGGATPCQNTIRPAVFGEGQVFRGTLESVRFTGRPAGNSLADTIIRR